MYDNSSLIDYWNQANGIDEILIHSFIDEECESGGSEDKVWELRHTWDLLLTLWGRLQDHGEDGEDMDTEVLIKTKRTPYIECNYIWKLYIIY